MRNSSMRDVGQRFLAGFQGSAKRFQSDDRGVTAVVFAIIFSVMILAAGVAIDYGRTMTSMARTQNALDTATLAASTKLGTENQDVEGKAIAQAFFDANTQKLRTKSELQSFEMDSTKGEVRATAKGSVVASLLKAAGFDKLGYNTKSKIARGNQNIEVALVLDNSGSMASSMGSLKTAATNLTTTLFAGAEGSERVRLSVVPFAASVNVGPDMKDSGWIDKTGASSLHAPGLMYDKPISRFDLFASVGVPWMGCVEARPAPHDTSDTPSGSGDTMFVPMFAPDEPDGGTNDNPINDGLKLDSHIPRNSSNVRVRDDNAGSNATTAEVYGNNYLWDHPESCRPLVCVVPNSRGGCRTWGRPAPSPITASVAQARTCKYTQPTLTVMQSTMSDSELTSGKRGPNVGCSTSKVLPLTATKTEVDAAINAMRADGNTNTVEGFMWGWRTLSPEPPFTEGRPYSTEDSQKIMIVMTDGENNLPFKSTHNKSGYAAFGYGAQGRLGTTHSTAAYRAALDQKLLEACSNAKAKNIKIYTIAFRLENDPATRSLLSQCATSTSEAHVASDNAGLISVFQGIGRDVSKLRIAG